MVGWTIKFTPNGAGFIPVLDSKTDNASLISIIQSRYSTLYKIDPYGGGFSFGNNAISIGDVIFSKNTQIDTLCNL